MRKAVNTQQKVSDSLQARWTPLIQKKAVQFRSNPLEEREEPAQYQKGSDPTPASIPKALKKRLESAFDFGSYEGEPVQGAGLGQYHEDPYKTNHPNQKTNQAHSAGLEPVVQRAKYVKDSNGKVRRREDQDKVGSNEEEVSQKDYQEYLFSDFQKKYNKDGVKSYAPGVFGKIPNGGSQKKNLEDYLIYRGMSVNNIVNRDTDKEAIFTVNNPDGQADAVQHIVHDDPDSPYLSFEKGVLNVSAGKYAHKPVDTQKRPIGVEKLDTGFFKQEKSYTKENREQVNKGQDRIGIVAGVIKKGELLDVSDKAIAEKELNPDEKKDGDEEKAVKLAVKDREILIKPGQDGVKRGDVPFYAKVEVVSEAYFKNNIDNQTKNVALGFQDGVYYKIEIDRDKSNVDYEFEFNFDRNYLSDNGEIGKIDNVQANENWFSIAKDKQDYIRKYLPGDTEKNRTMINKLIGQARALSKLRYGDQKSISGIGDKIEAIDRYFKETKEWFDGYTDGINKDSIVELENFDETLSKAQRMLKQVNGAYGVYSEIFKNNAFVDKIRRKLEAYTDEKNKNEFISNYAKVVSGKSNLEKRWLPILESFNENFKDFMSAYPLVSDYKKKLEQTGELFARLDDLLVKLKPEKVD